MFLAFSVMESTFLIWIIGLKYWLCLSMHADWIVEYFQNISSYFGWGFFLFFFALTDDWECAGSMRLLGSSGDALELTVSSAFQPAESTRKKGILYLMLDFDQWLLLTISEVWLYSAARQKENPLIFHSWAIIWKANLPISYKRTFTIIFCFLIIPAEKAQIAQKKSTA